MQSSAAACPSVREFPGRSEAEKALAVAFAGDRRSFSFAAILLAGQVPEILEDGDHQAADRALLAFGQRVSRSLLPGGGRLFRWSASAMVVILDRNLTPREVAEEVDRLPVSGARRVFALAREDSAERLHRRLDLFVARNL